MNFSTILSLLLFCLVNMISFVESTPGKIFYIALPVSKLSYIRDGYIYISRIISYQITIHNVKNHPVNVNISSPFPGFKNISQHISGLAVVNISIPNFADLMQNSWIQNLDEQSFTSNVTKQSLVIEAATDIGVLVAASSFFTWSGQNPHYSAQNILPVKHLGNTYSYIFLGRVSTIFIVATNPMLTNVSASVQLADCKASGSQVVTRCSNLGYHQRSFNSVLKQGEVFSCASSTRKNFSPHFIYISIDSDKPVAVFVQEIDYPPTLSSSLVPAKFVSQHGYPIVNIFHEISQTINRWYNGTSPESIDSTQNAESRKNKLFYLKMTGIFFIAEYNDTKIQLDNGTYLENLSLGIDDIPVSVATPIQKNAVTSTKPIQTLYFLVPYIPFTMPSVDQFLSGNSSFLVPYFTPGNYAIFIAISPQRNSIFLNGNAIDMDKWEYIASSTYATQTVPVPSGLNTVSASGKYMIIVSGCRTLICVPHYAFVPNMFLEATTTDALTNRTPKTSNATPTMSGSTTTAATLTTTFLGAIILYLG